MRILRIGLLCAVLLTPGLARTSVPASIGVQGRLTDTSGSPLPSGPKVLTFKIFDAAIDGTEVWPAGPGERQSVISDPGGMWSAMIGEILPLPNSVFADSVRWLEITVDDGVHPITTMPRVRLATSPYAQRVATVEGAIGGTVTTELQVAGAVSTAVLVTDTSVSLGPNHSVVLSSGTLTLTLPEAATCAGRQYVIKAITAADTTWIVPSPGSGNLIDGQSELRLKQLYQSTTLVSDGIDNWLVID